MDGWMNGWPQGRPINPKIHQSINPDLNNESSRISQKTLRKLQNHPAQGRHPGHLQQQTPQATARIIYGTYYWCRSSAE
jgi:hypothetical protein